MCLIYFCPATATQVQIVMDSLNDFCISSGLKVNFEKSEAMCSRKVPGAASKSVVPTHCYSFCAEFGKLFGFPFGQWESQQKSLQFCSGTYAKENGFLERKVAQ